MKPFSIFALIIFLAAGLHAQDTPPVKFTVASWNIGHFSLGKATSSRIAPDEAEFFRQAYCRVLDKVNADILVLVEYAPMLVNSTNEQESVVARKAILGNYPDAEIGPSNGFNCNAIFSNGFKVLDSKSVHFKARVQRRYYQVSSMRIGGDIVKVVATHLDWNQKKKGARCRSEQIKTLIEAFKDDPYVILCGDWNVGDTAEYDAFLEAGYDMANHGKMGDLPTFRAGDAPRTCLDNIIAKGFAIDRVVVVNEPQLSDHCLIQADLTKLGESTRHRREAIPSVPATVSSSEAPASSGACRVSR